MKIKTTLLSAICFCAVSAAYAQGIEKEMRTTQNASNVFIELGGPGLIYSINYDRRLGRIENGAGFRIGIGGAGGNGGGYIAIPAQFNYLVGNRGNYFELGAGATFFKFNDGILFDSDNGNLLIATATIGFRKQAFGKKGFTWRAGLNPLIADGSLIPWPSVSLGYRF